jgi:hypothetical protein
MANHAWDARARHLIDHEVPRLKQARSDQELRLGIIDSHAALEIVLRGYLTDVYGIEGLLDKSKWSFPSVLQVFREETEDALIPRE